MNYLATCLSAISLFCLLSTSQIHAERRPNLLIIHTDEHSFRTLSCYRELMSDSQANIWGKGNNVETPFIDSIAEQGALANNYYAASPVCTPSRASLVTGLYPQATGAPKNGLKLQQDIPTFATILRDAGYSTSYVGKWHLDGHDKYSFGIEYKAGFEDNRWMMRGGHAPYFHIKEGKFRGISEKVAAKQPKNEVIHLTDFFTDKTLEILERDKNKPFAIMLSIPDPHTPDYATPPYNTMFSAMNPVAPFTMNPDWVDHRPAWGRDTSKNEAVGFDAEALRQYFGMVKHIDDSVGRLLKFLKDNDLVENTIVVFTADHGDMFFEHKRRNKGVPYEASSKIPFVIRYPEKIPAGKIIRKAYANVDFTPTILGLMQVDTEAVFHGSDTTHDFTSSELELTDDRITYYAKSGGWWVAAVDNRYKLVVDKKESPWLIDLQEDPNEMTNQFNNPEYAPIAARLMNELRNQLVRYDEPGLKVKQPYIYE